MSARDLAQLRDSQVHVWSTCFPLGPDAVDAAWPILNDRERTRAEAYRFSEDRRRFCASRLMVRSVLASYTGEDPQALAFGVGAHGKPWLMTPGRQPGLRFNLTHCRTAAMLAITLHQEVGIDAEDIRPVPDCRALAHRFFAPEEAAAVDAAGDRRRPHTFLKCWTRKEAVVKALGSGLNVPLAGFSVPLEDDAPASIRLADHSGQFQTVALVDVSRPGLAAAVAVVGSIAHIWRTSFDAPVPSPAG